MTKEIDSQFSNYDNILLLGDFNSEPTKETKETFCQIRSLKNIIKVLKNPENPIMIELLLTTKLSSFQNSTTYEAGLRNFHKMTVGILKAFSKKQSPKIILYRN